MNDWSSFTPSGSRNMISRTKQPVSLKNPSRPYTAHEDSRSLFEDSSMSRHDFGYSFEIVLNY